jgi:hypothetical protein
MAIRVQRALAAIAAIVAATAFVPASAQLPTYPQTLPPNTVVGRLGIGSGPAEAIPFWKFQSGIIGNVPAASLYGNPAPTAAPIGPIFIQGLSSIGTPDKTSDLLPIYDHTTGGLKSVQPSALLNAVCSTASTFLWNSAGTWVCQTLGSLSASLGLPISLSLYIPIPTADDTAAFNSAIADCNHAGGCQMICPAGATYTVSQVSIPSNTSLSGSCTIKQKTSGTAPILISAKSNVKVSGITIFGTLLDNHATNGCGSATPPCSNQTVAISGDYGIQVISGDRVWIVGTTVTEFGNTAINVKNSSRTWIVGNNLYSNALGIYLLGGNQYSTVDGNLIVHTSFYSLTPTTDQFSVGISLDTPGGITAQNFYTTISNNKILDLPYGQGILVHEGQFVSITGNVMNDVSTGIAVNIPTSAPDDNIDYITVTGNVMWGTAATSIPTESDNGMTFVGSSSKSISNITVTGNTVYHFNAVQQGNADGCIVLAYIDSVTVNSNTCSHNYSNGIVLSTAVTNALVNSNTITTVTAVGSHSVGIWGQSSPTGIISSNLISSASDGVKIDGTATNVKYSGLQQCLSVTTCTSP